MCNTEIDNSHVVCKLELELMVLWPQGMNSLMERPNFLSLSLSVRREDERRGAEIKATNTHQVLTICEAL